MLATSLEPFFDRLAAECTPSAQRTAAARRRIAALGHTFYDQDDVVETLPFGSLARGTQIEPIKDADMLVVFDAAVHPRWGESSDTVLPALCRTLAVIEAGRAHPRSPLRRVVAARAVDHSVKCWFASDGFPVDVMPVVRHPESGLLLPELATNRWLRSDPELLVRRVAQRDRRWPRFAPLVRLLKQWNEMQGRPMTSLMVEVLALERLPADMQAGRALAAFFATAPEDIQRGVHDPAGLCGALVRDLDRPRAVAAAAAARKQSRAAVDCERRGDIAAAAAIWSALLTPSPMRAAA